MSGRPSRGGACGGRRPGGPPADLEPNLERLGPHGTGRLMPCGSVSSLLLVEKRRHRLDAVRRVARAGEARKIEGVFVAQQERVVVVGGVVPDRLLALVGDHDRDDVTAAGVGAAAAGTRLADVGEVVLVPGDDDGVAALLPDFRGHDLAHGVPDVAVAGGDQPGLVRTRAGAVHVVALVRNDQAEAGQIAGGQVGGELGIRNHVGQVALGVKFTNGLCLEAYRASLLLGHLKVYGPFAFGPVMITPDGGTGGRLWK